MSFTLGLKLSEILSTALGRLAPADLPRIRCHKGIWNGPAAVGTFEHEGRIQRGLLQVKWETSSQQHIFKNSLVLVIQSRPSPRPMEEGGS